MNKPQLDSASPLAIKVANGITSGVHTVLRGLYTLASGKSLPKIILPTSGKETILTEKLEVKYERTTTTRP